MQRITYWAPVEPLPNNGGGGRSPIGMFETTVPFMAPRHLMAEVGAIAGTDEGFAEVDYSLQPSGYVFIGTSTEADPRNVPGASRISNVGSKVDIRRLRRLTVVYF